MAHNNIEIRQGYRTVGFVAQVIMLAGITLLFWMFAWTNVHAAPWELSWSRATGGNASGPTAMYEFNGSVYAGGYVSGNDTAIRIERRSSVNGLIVWAVNENITGAGDYVWAVTADSSGVYLGIMQGQAINGEGGSWRIEKRNLSNGGLLWAQAYNPNGWGEVPQHLFIDGNDLYAVGLINYGSGSNPNYSAYNTMRIEKRSASTGGLVWAQNSRYGYTGFGSGGMKPASLQLVGPYIYIGGSYDNGRTRIPGNTASSGNSACFIEKRAISNGGLTWVRHHNPSSLNDQCGNLVADPSGIYHGVAETDDSSFVRGPFGFYYPVGTNYFLEKRDINTGGVVWKVPAPSNFVVLRPGLSSTISIIASNNASGVTIQHRNITSGALVSTDTAPASSVLVWVFGGNGNTPIWRSNAIYSGMGSILGSSWTVNKIVPSNPLPPSNQLPTATITVPAGNTTVAFGSTVTFTGTGNDPDGTITAYGWNLGGCGAGANISSASSFTKNDLPVGVNTMYFHVRDNSSAWSAACDSVTVTVVNRPDLIASTATPAVATRNTPVTLSASIQNIGNVATPNTAVGAMTTYTGTGAAPYGIASDGTNMWVANGNANSVTKVSPTGAMTTYAGTGAGPRGIAFDGTNMWTANTNGNSVTKVSPTGAMTTYSGTGGGPSDIVFSGTNMWTANVGSNSVTRITPTGGMTTYALPVGGAPWGIASDGTNVWVARWNANSVTKVSPTGVMTTYSGTGAVPRAIAFDGTNMWTANGTALSGSSVTRISPTGGMTTYPLARVATDIAFDGTNMWVVNFSNNSVTRVSPSGVATVYSGTGSSPWNIASDGTNMWVTNSAANSVTKVGANSGFQNFFQVATATNGGGVITDLAPTTISTLAAGANAPISRSYTFPNAQTYSVRACADKGSASDPGIVVEASEVNNCSPWWTDVVVSSSAPTATLSATPCTIPVGQSTCTGSFTWNIQNATGPNLYNATRNVTYSSNTQGNSVSFALRYGINVVQARNNSSVLRTVTPTAACDLTVSSWNGTICAPAAPQCNDTTDNDGDGLNNFPADPGCSSATDTTESPNPACSNNSDDDGDGLFDVNDPGCENTSGVYDPRDNNETNIPPTQCNDNIDNDNDGHIDWDGNGTPANADPGCANATDTNEFNIGTIRPR